MKRDILMCLALLLLTITYYAYPQLRLHQFEARNHQVIADFETMIESYRTMHQVKLLRGHGQNTSPDYASPENTTLSTSPRSESTSLSIPKENENTPLSRLAMVSQQLTFSNHILRTQNQPHLADPFLYDHPSFGLQGLGLDTNVIGILNIPAIGLYTPIYLGTSMQHLHAGAAHLTHSSFPVGGEATNTVIAGHRNQTYSRVFRHLNRLQVGDEIHVTNLLETTIYVVTETKTITPCQTHAISKQEGRELVTLITTSRWRGTRRLVVVAERTL